MIDLRFDRVSKRYRIRHEDSAPTRNPLKRVLKRLRAHTEDFWAVRDVSFEVRRGEALGIIGHNGAGKSTILKLLSNITTPTSGEIMINGRLAALIEVGSGFHPELTGRENIFLSGSILGMKRHEIEAKLDQIVDFAGVNEFLDTPVKRYSSGMYLRLGFAIAAHLDADVLLLDEVLAVGDANFQSKCLQRVRELRESGKTIVFISHDLGAVERLCDRALLMERGRLIAEGSPDEVIREYQRKTADLAALTGRKSDVTSGAEIVSISFHNEKGDSVSSLQTGDALIVKVRYRVHREPVESSVEVFFYTPEGELASQLFTSKNVFAERSEGCVEFYCPELGLSPGIYLIDTTIDKDWKFRCASFRVDPGKRFRGRFYMPHTWRFVEEMEEATNERIFARS
ncbi:MAG: ABC transporter ATP-binding protein [Pyrinomonas sp.]|uniref:ABC transporter ATP-binding protein n=1 Tax=Pyrinomonas sp. TaxID=2080306 RepID=UPI003325EB71